MKASSRNKKSKIIPVIAENRRVTHNYFLYESFQAGLVLQGWEVKAIRARQVSLKEAHIHFSRGEAFLVDAHFTPPRETCTHTIIQPKQDRKILLKQKEISFLREKVQCAGFTVVIKNLHWTGPWVKCSISLAKGKKLYDKRESHAQRDWQKDRARIVKSFA